MSVPVVLLPLVAALLAAPASALAGWLRPASAAPVGAALAAVAFGATLWAWGTGGDPVDVAWAPSWGLRFSVGLDGLAVLYALLATGVGFAVLVYSSRYLPLHLGHEGRPQAEAGRFYFFMLLFMGSMVGLAMARDLILIFVFWDLTAVASYFLIGYDRHDPDSRASALMALLVTGVTAVLLLIAAVILHAAHGTYQLPELIERTRPGAVLAVSGALIAAAGLAKSAQVPLHFWLPRAMAAPTPVSAYLHSAAMVAAGVLLIGRVYPLLQKSDVLLDALLVVGAASILVGGVLALTRDVLKQLLAYSTVSQYGYVVFMFGLGGEYGVVGASFYVIAHALAKSALFLTAGAVTEATGEDRLSRLGGQRKGMPVLAAASGVAALGLAAAPLTIGFFKDELLFGAALERGPAFVALAVSAAALTLAYVWRFWSGIFLGPRAVAGGSGGGERELPRALLAPVVALAAFVVVGGVLVGPFEGLAEAAGKASFAAPVSVDPAYHLDARPENLMALAAYAVGFGIVVSRPVWSRAALGVSRLGEVAGPERVYGLALGGLNRLSDGVHRAEVRDFRSRIAAILLPAGVLIGAGVLATPTLSVYRVGEVRLSEAPLLLALAAVAVASLTTAFTRRHVTLALVLSSAGFVLATVYAFFGAPDVALVAVLVETVLTLIFLATLRLIPYEVLHRQATLPLQKIKRKVFISCVAGATALAVSWGALSQPTAEESAARKLLGLTPDAHAKDAVTAILADFRGLDTLGEITVVALVLLGVTTLLNGALPGRGTPATGFGRPGPSGARAGASAGVGAGASAGPTSVMVRKVAGLLFLPTLVVAAGILVKGYAETGDGFSAGVVAALGVLLQYMAFGREEAEKLPLVRSALPVAFAGLLVAVAVAAAPLFLGDPILTHYPPARSDPVYLGTLELITAVLFDVGVFMLVFGFAVGAMTIFTRAATDDAKSVPDEDDDVGEIVGDTVGEAEVRDGGMGR